MAARKSKKKIELETLSTNEIRTLKTRNTVDKATVQKMVEYIKENLVDQVNGDNEPIFVSLQGLHEKFALKAGYSKKKDKYSINRHVYRVLHKIEKPAIWCRYLRKTDGTRFVAFYSKK